MEINKATLEIRRSNDMPSLKVKLELQYDGGQNNKPNIISPHL
jgi:hypothetical protein